LIACGNRRQVIQWYKRGFDSGVRADVCDITSVGDSVLVGLAVTGNPDGGDAAAPVERWQVLAMSEGLVSDIRGFEDRPSALAYASNAIA